MNRFRFQAGRRLRIPSVVLLVGVAVLLASCGPAVKVTELSEFTASSHEREIDIYQSPDEIFRKYKEVALLSADDKGWDQRHILKKLILEKARELGADAVIMGDIETEKKRGPRLVGTVVAPHPQRYTLKATAIVYTQH